MAKSKFTGKVQDRPKLNSYTLIVRDDRNFLSLEQVKAVDVAGAKALGGPGVLFVLKGHPEVVG